MTIVHYYTRKEANMFSKKSKKMIDSEIRKVPKYVKIPYYFIIIASYLIIIGLDWGLRAFNEQYAARELEQLELVTTQLLYMFTVLVLLAFVHIWYVQFIKIQKELTDKFDLTNVNLFPFFLRKKKNLRIEKDDINYSITDRMFTTRIQIAIWIFSAAIMIGNLIPHLIDLPGYFPRIPISYAAESVFILMSIPTVFIYIMFVRMFYFIVSFYTNLCKKAKVNEHNLHPLYNDPSGGFGKTQRFLLFTAFIVAIASFCDIFVNLVMYVYLRQLFPETATPGEFLVFGIIISCIPIVFFIFVLLYPQIRIHKLIEKYKKEKINEILAEKALEVEKIVDKKKIEAKEKRIKFLKTHDYFLSYYKSLSAKPRMLKTLGYIFTTIASVASLVFTILKTFLI